MRILYLGVMGLGLSGLLGACDSSSDDGGSAGSTGEDNSRSDVGGSGGSDTSDASGGNTTAGGSSALGAATGCDAVETTAETFDNGDEPQTIAIDTTTYSVSSPWGYDRAKNAERKYPVVVNGCWGEGAYFTDEIRQEFPAFYLNYSQECSSESEGAQLADIIDAAVSQGIRIDEDRVYLTGFSKGGSGSYKLVRGFLSEGKLFAAVLRLAGQSESILPDEAVEKTAIWYHVGLDDTAARVTVAQDAYAFLEDHAQNEDAVETSATDDFTGHHRTTWTLTKEGLEVVKYSEYEGMGHVTGPPYADPAVFDWLFGQSLACR